MGAAVDKVFASCLLTGFILSLLLSSSATRFLRLRLPFRFRLRVRLPRFVSTRGRFRVRRPRVSARQVESVRPEVGEGLGAPVAPPWLAPLVLGTFTTMFGASGLAIRSVLHLSAVPSIAFAALCGVASSYLAAWAASRMFAETAHVVTGNPILLSTGHVSLSIPEGGIGTIAYVAEGKRATMPARSKAGGSLQQGTRVIVVDLDGKVAVVQEY